MNEQRGWMATLYAWLLRFYPAPFRDEFAAEMVSVFAEASAVARRGGRWSLLRWWAREFGDLLPALVREQWRDLRRKDPPMNQELSVDSDDQATSEGPDRPLEVVAGILPFLLFGLMYTLYAVDYHRGLTWIDRGAAGYLVVLAILLAGLGAGWALRFPRWSYAYLGVILMLSLFWSDTATPGFRLFGYTFGREHWAWRAWLPLLALAATMLLLTRTLQPLVQLLRGMRHDWTRLSFALYAAVTWLLMGVSYDSKGWYNETLYLPLNMLLTTLLFAAGAFLYMRARQPWPRVLALQGALALFLPLELLVTALLDGHSEFGQPATVAGWLLYLLLWLLWLSPPLWPGLAQRAWRSIRAG